MRIDEGLSPEVGEFFGIWPAIWDDRLFSAFHQFSPRVFFGGRSGANSNVGPKLESVNMVIDSQYIDLNDYNIL